MAMIALFVLSLLALVSAMVVVTHLNAIVGALALAFNLMSIAGFYFLLDAQFIALLQVIVYAGAIMVLILFVIMLLNLKEEMGSHPTGRIQGALAPILGLLFALILVRSFLGVRGGFPPRGSGYGTVESLGRELYGRFFYPFEVVSLLLVAAMVGAVLLAKRKL
jgi:NADH-quinone oxidoreductase subunit J